MKKRTNGPRAMTARGPEAWELSSSVAADPAFKAILRGAAAHRSRRTTASPPPLKSSRDRQIEKLAARLDDLLERFRVDILRAVGDAKKGKLR
jgi:hypothetical protein